jgi:hypothetical protein
MTLTEYTFLITTILSVVILAFILGWLYASNKDDSDAE